MKNIWKFLAVLALAGGLTACNKDKGPDGPTDYSGGCEAVDMGLSVKWASYNVGAKAPEEYGSYFVWGETKEKSNYDWSNYKWGKEDRITKYNNDVEGGDGLKTLLPEDDAATVNWGTKWRTPTCEEIDDLLDDANCERTWDAAKKGYTVKSLKTGNSIFLPAAGSRNEENYFGTGSDGLYWSSTVNEKDIWPGVNAASIICFESYKNHFHNGGWRYAGLSVRAVTEYQYHPYSQKSIRRANRSADFIVIHNMDNAYQSNGRHKWYLKCHLIFVCKYRKRLLEGNMQEIIKEIFSVIEHRSDFNIDIMETDKDERTHILERWIFRVLNRRSFTRNCTEIHRKPGVIPKLFLP